MKIQITKEQLEAIIESLNNESMTTTSNIPVMNLPEDLEEVTLTIKNIN